MEKIFMTVVDKHAPFKSKRVRNKNNPWMTPEIRTLLINRDKLKRNALISNDTDNWLHFKLARNKCSNMLKEAKRDYYDRLFAVNKGNTNEVWNTINELISRSSKSQNISSLLINKKVVTNNTEIAECLNQYFAEMGSK
jgi:hypothetical protein